MSIDRDPFSDQPDPQLPPRMAEDLREIYAGGKARFAVDHTILNAARARMLAWRRRARVLRWGGGAAAAALLLLCIHLVFHVSQPQPQQVARRDPMDLTRHGRVDILDAYFLARQIKTQPADRLLKAWDFNGDGMVNQQDVDRIAQRAVSLGEAPASGRNVQ